MITNGGVSAGTGVKNVGAAEGIGNTPGEATTVPSDTNPLIFDRFEVLKSIDLRVSIGHVGVMTQFGPTMLLNKVDPPSIVNMRRSELSG